MTWMYIRFMFPGLRRIRACPARGIIRKMVDEANLKRERIDALREYIRLLEKVHTRIWAGGLSPAEKIVLDTLERRVSWLVEVGSALAGIAIFALSAWLGRFIARSPLILVAIMVGAGVLGLMVATMIYRNARAKIAEQEMRIAQLEIYKLEDELN